jgi:hypothetical protein
MPESHEITAEHSASTAIRRHEQTHRRRVQQLRFRNHLNAFRLLSRPELRTTLSIPVMLRERTTNAGTKFRSPDWESLDTYSPNSGTSGFCLYARETTLSSREKVGPECPANNTTRRGQAITTSMNLHYPIPDPRLYSVSRKPEWTY